MDTQQLEKKRKLFERDGYVVSVAQGRRFQNRLQLLKGTLEYSSTSTRSRKVLLKKNLERIASFSSALLVLCSVIPEEVLAHQFDISQLKDWWRGVSYPSNLKKFVQQLCVEVGIDYIETVHKDAEDTIAIFGDEAVLLRAVVYVAQNRNSDAYKKIPFDRLIRLPFYLKVDQLEVIDHTSEIVEVVFNKHVSGGYNLFDDWMRYLRCVTNKDDKAQALLEGAVYFAKETLPPSDRREKWASSVLNDFRSLQISPGEPNANQSNNHDDESGAQSVDGELQEATPGMTTTTLLQ
ncbi:hypothetical protein PENOC_112580 [Penicillium occitanis (nom. inval.)]|nr:hypothetical protein PENOC_112580 [Penicillium occitanis (nom. inval.)]